MSLSLSKKALSMFETDKISTKSKKIKPAKKAAKTDQEDVKIEKLLMMSSSTLDSRLSRKVRNYSEYS